MALTIGTVLATLAQSVQRTEVPWGSLMLSLSAGLLGAAVVALVLRRRPGVERLRRRFRRA